MIFMAEQRTIIQTQNPFVAPCETARLIGSMWRSLSGKYKLVYDSVAEKARNNPITSISFRTFEGI